MKIYSLEISLCRMLLLVLKFDLDEVERGLRQTQIYWILQSRGQTDRKTHKPIYTHTNSQKVWIREMI